MLQASLLPRLLLNWWSHLEVYLISGTRLLLLISMVAVKVYQVILYYVLIHKTLELTKGAVSFSHDCNMSLQVFTVLITVWKLALIKAVFRWVTPNQSYGLPLKSLKSPQTSAYWHALTLSGTD